jgi:two-component system CheB/CheR fusion protein
MERRPSQIYEVEWPTASGEAVQLEVQLLPLVDDNQALLGASISFADVTRSRRYREELEQANQGLEDAYAELQSTNEELETTNEELQSTVDELQTTNDELAQRTAELHQLTEFLESIWAGLGGAVAVLDPELRVLVWNQDFEELWGFREAEVQGQSFLDLDIGLPVDQVRPALQLAMSDGNGSQSTVLQATNRRGKTLTCRVTCSPLVGDDKTVRGVIVVVVEEFQGQPAAG